MAHKHLCRHYEIDHMGDGTCKLGVILEQNAGPYERAYTPDGRSKLPCRNPDYAHRCPEHQPYTQEELDADDRAIAEAIKGLAGLMTGEHHHCIHCGAEIQELEQVRRSVYARPCNCRQYQGRVPANWKPLRPQSE